MFADFTNLNKTLFSFHNVPTMQMPTNLGLKPIKTCKKRKINIFSSDSMHSGKPAVYHN